MKHHGNLRVLSPEMQLLKAHFDDHVQTTRLTVRNNNQMLAHSRRTDVLDVGTLDFLRETLKPYVARLPVIRSNIVEALKAVAKKDPLVKAALGVKGLGPIVVAALTIYVDFDKMVCARCHKAEPVDPDENNGVPGTGNCVCEGGPVKPLVSATANLSSLWKYAGLHCASHERYTKGESGGGNKTLRTALFNAATGMVKMDGMPRLEDDGSPVLNKDGTPKTNPKSPYRDLYDAKKARLAISEKIVKTRNVRGVWTQLPWKLVMPCHRAGAALRDVKKAILADFWYVGRTLKGLSTGDPYSKAMLGHTHCVNPRDRGWKF
jgi:hypothetical protein